MSKYQTNINQQKKKLFISRKKEEKKMGLHYLNHKNRIYLGGKRYFNKMHIIIAGTHRRCTYLVILLADSGYNIVFFGAGLYEPKIMASIII